ncbi:MAG: hemolysin III family protein [Bacteroidia bacterium]
MDTIDHRKELANALTHGVPLVLYLVAIPLMMSVAAKSGDWANMLSAGIFGFGLLMVFASSTIYHSVPMPFTKHILRIFDHSSIFLLIGGSYTVFVQQCFSADFSFYFLLVFWSIILGGILFKVFFTGKYNIISTFFYVALGLISVFIIKPIWENAPSSVMALIVIGGTFYLSGVPFYLWKKYTYHHAVWHIFVFLGSFSHYIAAMLLLQVAGVQK